MDTEPVLTTSEPTQKAPIGSFILLGTALVLALLYFFLFSAPGDFPSRSIQNIRTGIGLDKVSEDLKERGVVRSVIGFRTAAIMLGGERGMQAGDYYFRKPENAFRIAWRVVHAERDIKTERITIPEGFDSKEIAELFDERFPKFDHEEFLRNAREGYLFPDTYFVEISATASSTLALLENNFNKKIETIRNEIEGSGKTLNQIITMASILESEARTKEDREIVAGILYKRIKLGMPLQVDASLQYITGRGSAELTQSDLKLESPYNTYIHLGLPPTPISNPGLESILAAIHPKTSQYLYFLTDTQGIMHYAKTFDEHKRNKEKYLSNT